MGKSGTGYSYTRAIEASIQARERLEQLEGIFDGCLQRPDSLIRIGRRGCGSTRIGVAELPMRPVRSRRCSPRLLELMKAGPEEISQLLQKKKISF